MGVITHESEYRSSIPPARLFKALIQDCVNLVPKVNSEDVKYLEVIEGDGGVGSIRKITFTEGSRFKYAKQKVEEIDEDNLQITYSLIEGGPLTDKLEKITYVNRFVEAPGGGTIIKNTGKYYIKGEDSSILNDDIIYGRKAKFTNIFKILDKYLIDNHDNYN